MNSTLASYLALGPMLAQHLFSANLLPAMDSTAIELSSNSVKLTTVLTSEKALAGSGAVPTQLLCSLADAVGQLLIEVSAPAGAVGSKKTLTFIYGTPPSNRSGDLVISATNTIDWTQPGDHELTIEGRDHRPDAVLFSAVLTVSVS